MNGTLQTVVGTGGNCNKIGFTLLELTIVVIILGLLATIAIPIYTKTVEKVRGEMCINNIRMIISAWQIYNTTHGEDWDPDYSFQKISNFRNILGVYVSEKYFGSPTNKTPGYYPDLDENKNNYYIYACRLSGKYYGNYIQYTYNSANGVETWSGNWFTTAGFPKPED